MLAPKCAFSPPCWTRVVNFDAVWLGSWVGCRWRQLHSVLQLLGSGWAVNTAGTCHSIITLFLKLVAHRPSPASAAEHILGEECRKIKCIIIC